MADGLIAGICPPAVRVCEVRADVRDVELSADEAMVVATSVPGRRAEFATGRWCAREALAQLGQPAVSIGRGDGGAPVWPAGVVGSITHCDGLRAAVVASRADAQALGVDAEPNAPLPPDVVELIALPAERADLAARPVSAVAWDRVLFCAKEAAFKAWFPVGRRVLEFADVRVHLEPGGTFRAHLPEGPLRSLAGRWTADHTFVAAVVFEGAVART